VSSPARVEGVVFVLAVSSSFRLLEGGRVGGNVRVFDMVARRRDGVGDFDAMLDGGELACFEIGQLFLGGAGELAPVGCGRLSIRAAGRLVLLLLSCSLSSCSRASLHWRSRRTGRVAAAIEAEHGEATRLSR